MPAARSMSLSDQASSGLEIATVMVKSSARTGMHVPLASSEDGNCRVSGQFLGVILVETGIITERALVETVAQQFGMAYEAVDLARVDWKVARQFPVSLLGTGRGFPIRADSNAITLAISNPLDVWTLSEFERTAGPKPVRPVLVLERELQTVVRAYQRQVLEALHAKLGGEGHGEAQ